jgi:ubiquinone/menaquinone biosynthesis C-methylase UbiE
MSLRNFFVLENYVFFFKRLIFPQNYIIDKLIHTVSHQELSELKDIKIEMLDIDPVAYKKWVNQFFPDWKSKFISIYHKKLIEFFTTYSLLKPCAEDTFMDAAGGIDSYIKKLACSKLYMQDIKILKELQNSLGKKIEYIECNAGSISLSDESVDKISCHHAFEHFQGDSDFLFIKEIQRLLRQGGKCCIMPIFIADHYVDLTDTITYKYKFDENSDYIVDPTASLPGGNRSGHYSRIYDLKSFQRRVLNNIDLEKFKTTFYELRINGNTTPDFKLKCHKYASIINRPYRALLIERL